MFEVDYVSASYGQCIVEDSGNVTAIHEKGSDNFDYDSDFMCVNCGKEYEELPE